MLFAVIAILLGLCFGSFLNVLIVRIPLNKSVVLPASACMSCGMKLRFYHNIPLISYLFLMGKCGFCKAKISFLYPLIEAISGVFGLFIYLKFGFSLESLFIGISILLLLALSIIDLKVKEVPDSINFWALIFALIGGVMLHLDLLFVIASSFSLAGFFTLLRFAFQSLAKKEALGEGDIIIVATMGALLGWKLSLIAVFISALSALIILIFCRRDYQIPYIPFLYLGTLVCLFLDNFFMAFLNNYILQV
ncbi:prepilin peptidase [Helicobacter sp. MIT 14-3879]|nr:prepilin peptidase [Helicobacter sp. MIT 14-3879]